MFGQFHTEMNIFSAIGTLLEGSGGPYLFDEGGVVAAGSLNKVEKASCTANSM